MEKSNPLKVILVEDSACRHYEVHAIIRKYFPDAEILHAHNKAEAQMIYESNPDVDLIIADLDINFEKEKTALRGKIGLEFLEEVRSENPSVTLIAYTIYNDIITTRRLAKIRAEHVRKYSFYEPTLRLITVIWLKFKHKVDKS